MPFMFYNQVAYNYEQNAVQCRQRSPIKQGGLEEEEETGEGRGEVSIGRKSEV